ncbi:MAG: hypothetical protein M3O09_02325 [Acidobacteriota bacterium]|nr:hypothetical protein [Acidobacteriota bacterium]
MRIIAIVCTLFFSAGIAIAQTDMVQGDLGNTDSLTAHGVAAYGRSGPRLISTPTLSLYNPTTVVGASNATAGNVAGATNSTLSIVNESPFSRPMTFYGSLAPRADTSEAMSNEPPVIQGSHASGNQHYFDFGIARSQDFVGVATLMSRKPSAGNGAPRVYSNQDIERLKQDSESSKSDAMKSGGKPGTVK